MGNNGADTKLIVDNDLIAVIGLGATGSPIADMLYRKYGSRFVLLSDSRHADRLRSGLNHINGRAFAPSYLSSQIHILLP